MKHASLSIKSPPSAEEAGVHVHLPSAVTVKIPPGNHTFYQEQQATFILLMVKLPGSR